MKWRLAEGQGEALYEIGVEDCGRLAGLTRDEMAVCNIMAHRSRATAISNYVI
jgi:GTPase